MKEGESVFKGKDLVEFKEVLKNKNHYAELFAEGSRELKDFLLFCFNNNIETNACCRGHIDEEMIYGLPQYVKFNIDNNKIEHLNFVIEVAYEIPGVYLDIAKKFNDDFLSLWLLTYMNDSAEKMFDQIKKRIKNNDINKKEYREEIKSILRVLKSFLRKEYQDYSVMFELRGNYNDYRLSRHEVTDGNLISISHFLYRNLDYDKMKDTKYEQFIENDIKTEISSYQKTLKKK